jgi:hypothetical protein
MQQIVKAFALQVNKIPNIGGKIPWIKLLNLTAG